METAEKISENLDFQQPDMTFSRQLRKATKDVHNLSDMLINAKFALALDDEGVWADGLLSFYEVYKYLESNLPEEYIPKELHRTAAFEKDLSFFLGKDWKETYEPRESVKKYIEHLEQVNSKSKELLFAFAFQMYMALMSGGQLLQKKRMVARKLWLNRDNDELSIEDTQPSNPDADVGDLEARPMPKQVTICPDGCAATYFPDKISILKAKLRTVLNEMVAKFDDKMREEFIQESRLVFQFNSEVVRNIKGVNRANLRKLLITVTMIVAVYFAIKLVKH